MKKADGFLSFIKGAIVGIGSLVPGVSSGSLIVSLSCYESFVESLKNFFKKTNRGLLLVVIPLILGLIAGLIGGSHLVDYFFGKFRIQTVFLFVGLITGGFMLIIKNHKLKSTKGSVCLFLLVFIFVILFNILILENILSFNLSNILISIILGLLTGLSVVIPGISASNFYILIGKYEYVLKSLKFNSEFTNILMGIIFIVAILITIFLIAKIVSFLLRRYKTKTYIVISSLMASSVVILLLQIGEVKLNFVNIFTSILTFMWGYILAKNVEKE